MSFLSDGMYTFVTVYSRHLNQMLHTADGNHHANKFSKNSDPDDISLFDGKGTFPEDSDFRKYIKNLPAGEVIEEVCYLLYFSTPLEADHQIEIDMFLSQSCEQAKPKEVQEYGYHRRRRHPMFSCVYQGDGRSSARGKVQNILL